MVLGSDQNRSAGSEMLLGQFLFRQASLKTHKLRVCSDLHNKHEGSSMPEPEHIQQQDVSVHGGGVPMKIFLSTSFRFSYQNLKE